MKWPFNYPGDNYPTNVFSQVIIVISDVIDDIEITTENILNDIVEVITK